MTSQPLTDAPEQPNCLEVMFEEWPSRAPNGRFRGFVYDRESGVMLFGCEAGKPDAVRSAVFSHVAQNTCFRRVE